MQKFAEQEEFELALDCREKLNMLSKIKLKRITSLNRDLNADVIARSYLLYGVSYRSLFPDNRRRYFPPFPRVVFGCPAAALSRRRSFDSANGKSPR